MVRCTLHNMVGIHECVQNMLIDDCETVKEYDVVLDLTNANVIIGKKEDIPANTLYLGTIYPETYGYDRIILITNSISREYQRFDYLDKFYNDVRKIIWDFVSNNDNFLTKTKIIYEYGSKYTLDVAYYRSFKSKPREINGKWFTPTVKLYIKPIIEYYYEKDKKIKLEKT